MNNKKSFALVAILVMGLILFAGCAGQQPAPPAEPPPTAQAEPEPNEPEPAHEIFPPEINFPDEIARLYYDFFRNNFTIIEYAVMHGPWQLWGHNTQGEVRLTKQVYINQIEGFDYPVLVLAEFIMGEDGVTLNELGLLNAYLIRDGQLRSDLSRAEIDVIFRFAGESEGGGWDVRYRDEILGSVRVNGELLFFLDFSGDVRTDGSMDIVLNWLNLIWIRGG